MTKSQFKIQSHKARLAFRKSRKVRLAQLVQLVHNETAPVLAMMGEIDAFIHSGQSLVGALYRQPDIEGTPTVERPALPVGLPMPPNVCINPTFAV